MKKMIVVALLVLTISSCSVTKEEIEDCEDVCSNNEGIDTIYPGVDYTSCHCANGAVFRLDN